MPTLGNYLNTSVDDAKMGLQCLLASDPQEALTMATNIAKVTEEMEGKKTLHKVALSTIRKAKKLIEAKEKGKSVAPR